MTLTNMLEHLLEDKGDVYDNSEVGGQFLIKPEINPYFLRTALFTIEHRLSIIEARLGIENE